MKLNLDGALSVSRQTEPELTGSVQLSLDSRVPMVILAAPGLQEIVDGILDRVAGNLQFSLEQSVINDYFVWVDEQLRIAHGGKDMQ